MERKNLKLKRDELLRLNFVKSENTRIVLKAVYKNQAINATTRFYAY